MRLRSVPNQKSATEPAQCLQHPVETFGEFTYGPDAGADEENIANNAEKNNGSNVLANNALAENESVLSSNRDNEGEPGSEAYENGGECFEKVHEFKTRIIFPIKPSNDSKEA